MTPNTRHAEWQGTERLTAALGQSCVRSHWTARSRAVIWLCPTLSVLWGAYRVFGPRDFYDPPPSQSPTCGATAIVNLCRLQGRDIEIADVLKRTRLGPDGIAVDDCARVLAELGVRCFTVRLAHTMDLPESAPCLCVMRARGGGHAVVAMRRATAVLLIDGGEARTLSSSTFNAVFGHVALIPCVQRS